MKRKYEQYQENKKGENTVISAVRANMIVVFINKKVLETMRFSPQMQNIFFVLICMLLLSNNTISCAEEEGNFEN